MDVAHDLLDKHIVDRHGHELGRVDGIVLEVRDGEPAKLAEMLIGASALGSRVNPTVGRWVHALEHALGLGHLRPIRIDCTRIEKIDDKITIDLPAGETSADVVDQRIRTWLLKLPGSR
jgi:sporulation protein YlmC with PRC-barrel domain